MTEPEFTEIEARHEAKTLEILADEPAAEVAAVEAPPLATPRQASEAAAAQVLGSFLKDRDSFAKVVDMLRNVHGLKVAHLSDEQIADLARTTYTEVIQESVDRAFHKTGRGRELKIKIEGF